MIKSSNNLVISEYFSVDTLNDIQTPDLVPYILDHRYFKFKMSKQLDINSEDSDDRQLLDLNKLLEAVMSEDNRTQVLNIVKELEECTAPNFAALPFENFTLSPPMTSVGPNDQLIQVSEPMVQRDLNVGTTSMPTTPQFLYSPESNFSFESETSDWELNNSLKDLSTSASPQPQNQALTQVMTSSPQMILVEPSVGSQAFLQSSTQSSHSSAQSSHSRQRIHSIGSCDTPYMGLENRNVCGPSFDNSSVFGTGPQYSGAFGQTQTGLPTFRQTFFQSSDQQIPQTYSEIGLNEGMTFPNTQPINIRPNTSIPIQSSSVPTYGLFGWNPNCNQSHLIPTYSEPAINSRQEVTSSGRKGFKITAAKRLKTYEFQKSKEEAINFSLNERVKDLENSIAFYKAKLEEKGFIDPYYQFKFN